MMGERVGFNTIAYCVNALNSVVNIEYTDQTLVKFSSLFSDLDIEPDRNCIFHIY